MVALAERLAPGGVKDERVGSPGHLVEHPRRRQERDLALLAVLRLADRAVGLAGPAHPQILALDVLPPQGVQLAGPHPGPGRELDHRPELRAVAAEDRAGIEQLAVLLQRRRVDLLGLLGDREAQIRERVDLDEPDVAGVLVHRPDDLREVPRHPERPRPRRQPLDLPE